MIGTLYGRAFYNASPSASLILVILVCFFGKALQPSKPHGMTNQHI
jgi:hypothetical protein